jgi:hypothetical protein
VLLSRSLCLPRIPQQPCEDRRYTRLPEAPAATIGPGCFRQFPVLRFLDQTRAAGYPFSETMCLWNFLTRETFCDSASKPLENARKSKASSPIVFDRRILVGASPARPSIPESLEDVNDLRHVAEAFADRRDEELRQVYSYCSRPPLVRYRDCYCRL